MKEKQKRKLVQQILHEKSSGENQEKINKSPLETKHKEFVHKLKKI